MTLFNKQQVGKLTVVLVMAALAAGCANNSRQGLPEEYHEWAFTQARTTDLTPDSFSHLENGRQGDRIILGQTPWGEHTEFSINERYFAASGRPCFKGLLEHENGSLDAVVCRYSANRWVASRAVAGALHEAPVGEHNMIRSWDDTGSAWE